MKKLIRYHEALQIVFEQGRKNSAIFLADSQLIPITEAANRICTEAILGREAVPNFNNSSMDGFAVRAEETVHASEAQPVIFHVQETVLAGHPPMSAPIMRPHICYEIMTGAPVPQGFDAIYKIEDVEIEYDSNKRPLKVVIREPIAKHANFRAKAADFAVGQKLFDAGSLLMPEQVMGLASVGVEQIQVLRKPKIAVLSTGSELMDPHQPELEPGKIRNSTASYLVSAIPYFGAEVRFYGTVTDHRDLFTKILEQILADQPDIILTTGAVSKGTQDFIPDVVREMGAEVLFHNVAIRPGKPQLFAQFANGPAFFGIPGNPISTAVGLRFFIHPYLRGFLRQQPERPLRARLSADVEKAPGLRSFFKAQVTFSEDGNRVLSLAGQPSFMVSPLMRANSFVVLEEEPEMVLRGTSVDVYPLYPSHYDFTDDLRSDHAALGRNNCC